MHLLVFHSPNKCIFIVKNVSTETTITDFPTVVIFSAILFQVLSSAMLSKHIQHLSERRLVISVRNSLIMM
jgi:hypothetical protein